MFLARQTPHQWFRNGAWNCKSNKSYYSQIARYKTMLLLLSVRSHVKKYGISYFHSHFSSICQKSIVTFISSLSGHWQCIHWQILSFFFFFKYGFLERFKYIRCRWPVVKRFFSLQMLSKFCWMDKNNTNWPATICRIIAHTRFMPFAYVGRKKSDTNHLKEKQFPKHDSVNGRRKVYWIIYIFPYFAKKNQCCCGAETTSPFSLFSILI